MTTPPVDALVLREVTEGLPDWWREGGNLLRAPQGAVLPEIARDPWKAAPTGCRVTLASLDAQLKTIRLWGHGCEVRVGADSIVHDGQINCGDGARVILGDGLNAAWAAWIDARNGGSIEVGEDGLWSSQVRLATDDMHAILDVATGRRINIRGGAIRVGRHVWLGMDCILLPGVTVGDGAIVGIRAVLTADVPPNAVAAGVPARVVRQGATWSHDDLEAGAGPEPPPVSTDGPEPGSWFRRLRRGAPRRP